MNADAQMLLLRGRVTIARKFFSTLQTILMNDPEIEYVHDQHFKDFKTAMLIKGTNIELSGTVQVNSDSTVYMQVIIQNPGSTRNRIVLGYTRPLIKIRDVEKYIPKFSTGVTFTLPRRMIPFIGAVLDDMEFSAAKVLKRLDRTDNKMTRWGYEYTAFDLAGVDSNISYNHGIYGEVRDAMSYILSSPVEEESIICDDMLFSLRLLGYSDEVIEHVLYMFHYTFKPSEYQNIVRYSQSLVNVDLSHEFGI